MGSRNRLVDLNSGMQPCTYHQWGRRDFVKGVAALAGAAGLTAYDMRSAAAEPPPETTTLKIYGGGGIISCVGPMYAAEQLFHSEGFTEVRYLEYPTDTTNWPPKCLLTGEADISLSFPPTDILHIDRGDPLVILGGSHIGCVELFATNRIRSTPDLKGKTVAVPELWSDDHIFVSMFARYVGLDPQKDINWAIVRPPADFVQLFTEGKIDAVMFGPPRTQQMRAKKIGHVLVNTTTDKPWSHQFCCLVATTREFVRKHPVATKRALRAIIKGADVCAVEPRRVARLIADKGLMRYEDTLQTLQEIPYGKWRDFDAESTLRFYALRLHEAGIIKSNPQKIIAQGTDWRFLNELKRELKA